MQVWVLYNYNEIVDSIYTTAGKEIKQAELLEKAINRRTKINEQIASDIIELKELRQPYITEAEILLDTEREAKETNNIGLLTNVRKQRKVLLRQAEHLTHDIRCKEEKILASQRMTKAELMSTYGDGSYWEEFCVHGEAN